MPEAFWLPLLCKRICSLLLAQRNTSLSANPSPSLSTQMSGETHVQAQLRESISYSVFITECQRVTITSGAEVAGLAVTVKLPELAAPVTTKTIRFRRVPSRRLGKRLV